MNKKIISALMAFTMFTATAYAADFTDMPSDAKAAQAIENAVRNKLLGGYDDNTVRPDANIRRSEMAAIITRACKVTQMSDLSMFSDVKEDDWFYSAMSASKSMGAFEGDGDRMRPYDNISFQECFTVLARVFNLYPEFLEYYDLPDELPEGFMASGNTIYDISALKDYKDSDNIADWAKPYVAGMVSHGAWSGKDGMLTPNDYITRAEFAEVMDNIIKNYIDEPGEYNGEIDGSTMIRCDGVKLKGTQVSGNIYIGDSVSAGGVELDSVTAERLVVRGCAKEEKKSDGSLFASDEAGITVTGTFDRIEVIRPYIHLDASKSEYKTIYGIEKDIIDLP